MYAVPLSTYQLDYREGPWWQALHLGTFATVKLLDSVLVFFKKVILGLKHWLIFFVEHLCCLFITHRDLQRCLSSVFLFLLSPINLNLRKQSQWLTDRGSGGWLFSVENWCIPLWEEDWTSDLVTDNGKYEGSSGNTEVEAVSGDVLKV